MVLCYVAWVLIQAFAYILYFTALIAFYLVVGIFWLPFALVRALGGR